LIILFFLRNYAGKLFDSIPTNVSKWKYNIGKNKKEKEEDSIHNNSSSSLSSPNNIIDEDFKHKIIHEQPFPMRNLDIGTSNGHLLIHVSFFFFFT
jgi:hypothetical protein